MTIAHLQKKLWRKVEKPSIWMVWSFRFSLVQVLQARLRLKAFKRRLLTLKRSLRPQKPIVEVSEAIKVIKNLVEVVEIHLEGAGKHAGGGVSVSGQTAISPIQLLNQTLQVVKVIRPSKSLGREAVKLSIFICKGILDFLKKYDN